MDLSRFFLKNCEGCAERRVAMEQWLKTQTDRLKNLAPKNPIIRAKPLTRTRTDANPALPSKTSNMEG